MSLQRLQFDMFTAFYCQLAYSAAQFGTRRVFYQWRQGPAANAARAARQCHCPHCRRSVRSARRNGRYGEILSPRSCTPHCARPVGIPISRPHGAAAVQRKQRHYVLHNACRAGLWSSRVLQVCRLIVHCSPIRAFCRDRHGCSYSLLLSNAEDACLCSNLAEADREPSTVF